MKLFPRIADDIISHQTDIKVRTEQLRQKNAELRSRSGELQEVLRSSQAQLLSDTSIPLELINQLAAAVRDLKTAHQADLGTLVERFGEAQDMFERQQRLLQQNSNKQLQALDGGPDNKEDPPPDNTEAVTEVNVIEEKNVSSDGKTCSTTDIEDKSKAWDQVPSSKEDGRKERQMVTILEEKEDGGTATSRPATDSPASQSEVVTAAFLASLTKNITPASAGSEAPASRYTLVQTVAAGTKLVQCQAVMRPPPPRPAPGPR